jgi:hypothetical protein
VHSAKGYRLSTRDTLITDGQAIADGSKLAENLFLRFRQFFEYLQEGEDSDFLILKANNRDFS